PRATHSLSLHDALPICPPSAGRSASRPGSRLRLFLHRSQTACLIFRNQGVDELVQGLAAQDLLQLVEGEVDAVVGNPTLREIVGDRKSTRLNSSHVKIS